MKQIIKKIFILLFMFTCCQFFCYKVYALDNNVYKTVTNNSIIYIVEEKDNFAYSWQFNKQEYKEGIDFSLKIDSNSKKINEINKCFDEKNKVKFLSFEHHGNLPTTALMKVKVEDKFKDGEELFLYYYNEDTNLLEYIGHNLIVKNGFVEFNIDHCSDYILTASIVKTAMNNPQSMGLIIIILIILGVILVAATLFMNSKK